MMINDNTGVAARDGEATRAFTSETVSFGVVLSGRFPAAI